MNLFGRKRIYLDYASATPVLPEALAAMCESEKLVGNPGSIHEEGVAALRALQAAREGIARELGCKPRQLIFTSGLSEGNNLAILGFARKLQMAGMDLSGTHWITSAIEHSSVLEAFGEVERQDGAVTFLDPDENGIIHPESLKNALRKNTVFVSLGWANNEIGVVQRLGALARVAHAHEGKGNVFFHSDAGQAPLYRAPQVHTLDVDMLSLGAGKLYGPRGIGALYVRDLETLAPLMLGGGQEKGLRAGTEEVSLASGFAKAMEVVANERHTEAERLGKLRSQFANELAQSIPGCTVNGDLSQALPHMLNVSIPNINAEYIVLSLDRAGIACSTKSACNEGQVASHVVAALGGPDWRARNTLRFSLGLRTSSKDIRRTMRALARLIKNTRLQAPNAKQVPRLRQGFGEHASSNL